MNAHTHRDWLGGLPLLRWNVGIGRKGIRGGAWMACCIELPKIADSVGLARQPFIGLSQGQIERHGDPDRQENEQEPDAMFTGQSGVP